MCLSPAKSYLRKQHHSCHQAWKFRLQDDSGSEGEEEDDTDYEIRVYDLIRDLGTIARRDALNLNLTMEENGANSKTTNELSEVRGHQFSF
jgi:hypothetical protein